MKERVCRDCHRFIETSSCPFCGSDSVSTDWAGYMIILDADKSEIAKKLDIKESGRYALRVK